MGTVKDTNNDKTKNVENIYWKLFKSTFLISAFTVGGGYVIVPLLKSKFVDEYGWLDDKEALDMVAIAQASPGVIAINTSIILGYRLRGWRGLVTTMFATILPPLIMLSVIAYFYDAFIKNVYIRYILRGMQVAATAIILDVAIRLSMNLVKDKNYIAIAIATISFILAYFFQVNIMYIVISCAMIGLLFLGR